MNEEEAVRRFIDQIRWLYEGEFGDFKRKVGNYIKRLEEAHPSLASGRGKDVLARMKMTAIYDPNGKTEETRRQVLKLAQELLESAANGTVH